MKGEVWLLQEDGSLVGNPVADGFLPTFGKSLISKSADESLRMFDAASLSCPNLRTLKKVASTCFYIYDPNADQWFFQEHSDLTKIEKMFPTSLEELKDKYKDDDELIKELIELTNKEHLTW